MIVLKKALPRRTFLRGMGVTLALPLLDAMVPAFTPIRLTAASGTRRLGFFYVPNGMTQDSRLVPTTATNFDLPLVVQPLEPVRKQLILTNGLDNKQVEPLGDGNGNHPRAAGGWLNGSHILKTEGANVRAGITVDQVAAMAWAKETRLPSLEMGLDGNQVVGQCDNGYSCLYQNTIAWRSATDPLPVENNPGVIFERMFGETNDPTLRRAQLGAQRSILDSVMGEFGRLQSSLGASDRATVEGYLASVREVEQRIQRAENDTESAVALPDRPFGVPRTFADHVSSCRPAGAGVPDRHDAGGDVPDCLNSGNTYPEIGVPQAHHGLSHHGRDPEKLAMVAKINAYHLTFFSQFLQRLQATPDGDGTLLDHSMMLWGSGLGDGDAHSLNLSTIVVGGAGLGVKGDRSCTSTVNRSRTCC